MIQCKNCGYPVINGMHTCPNCLAEMPDKIVAPVAATEEEWYDEDEIPYCTLRPISLPGEREMPEEVYEEGAEVYLSRHNTVSHDKSIDDDERPVSSSRMVIGSLRIVLATIQHTFMLELV